MGVINISESGKVTGMATLQVNDSNLDNEDLLRLCCFSIPTIGGKQA